MSTARLLSLRRIGDALQVALVDPAGVLRLLPADDAAVRELADVDRATVASALGAIHREAETGSANLHIPPDGADDE